MIAASHPRPCTQRSSTACERCFAWQVLPSSPRSRELEPKRKNANLRYPQVLCIISPFPWFPFYFKVQTMTSSPPLETSIYIITIINSSSRHKFSKLPPLVTLTVRQPFAGLADSRGFAEAERSACEMLRCCATRVFSCSPILDSPASGMQGEAAAGANHQSALA